MSSRGGDGLKLRLRDLGGEIDASLLINFIWLNLTRLWPLLSAACRDFLVEIRPAFPKFPILML